jgi:ethanolamine utilization protein EutA
MADGAAGSGAGDGETTGGRVFFTSTGRTLEQDDELRLLSVGVDIGSSTSHLVFSRIVLERLDSRYVVTSRETLHQSEILLTPYAAADAIDAAALGAFIDRQYRLAGVAPDEVDTGALILTGIAVRRSNARRIGELFAAHAGKMVAVSAGDSLEATMAAYGSGAVARSIRDRRTVMNVDIGGGTSKIAVCADGAVVEVTAVDIGARLVCLDGAGRVVRVEEAGRRLAEALGLSVAPDLELDRATAQALAGCMADHLFAAMQGKDPAVGKTSLLRLAPLSDRWRIDEISFSGGVAEYLYGREGAAYGDLGPLLAVKILERVRAWGPPVAFPDEGIRATVVGASQYTIQVSGGTIFVSPLDILPLRNVPVVAPRLDLEAEAIDPAAVAGALGAALRRLDLDRAEGPIAVAYGWRGSATFQRLDGFCRGIAAALGAEQGAGRPIVLVGDSDIGGLIGMHLREELHLAGPVVSIDGIELKEFDYVDIGTILESSGAVPVAIKSLVFPATAAIGREWEK